MRNMMDAMKLNEKEKYKNNKVCTVYWKNRKELFIVFIFECWALRTLVHQWIFHWTKEREREYGKITIRIVLWFLFNNGRLDDDDGDVFFFCSRKFEGKLAAMANAGMN